LNVKVILRTWTALRKRLYDKVSIRLHHSYACPELTRLPYCALRLILGQQACATCRSLPRGCVIYNVLPACRLSSWVFVAELVKRTLSQEGFCVLQPIRLSGAYTIDARSCSVTCKSLEDVYQRKPSSTSAHMIQDRRLNMIQKAKALLL
jgi:hypothetical protein